MGFCLLANVAAGVRQAQAALGTGRIAIIDIDVHHGNGTQEIFERNPNIFFASLHQYPFYPGSGARTERGAGDGLGSTLNVPLPAGIGDEDYLDAFDRLVVPAVEDFDPDLIFLSAGFDLLWPDPLADLRITLTGLRAVIRRVATLADRTSGGRIVGVLEGGYDLGALSSGISNTIRLFEDADADLDDPIGPPQRPPERHRDYIDDLCRFFQGISVDDQNPVRANRMTNR
jgi:acetoin utilization deacetylase AcuC-like enzyme